MRIEQSDKHVYQNLKNRQKYFKLDFKSYPLTLCELSAIYTSMLYAHVSICPVYKINYWTKSDMK